jgi:hypothetical protein
MTTWRRRKTTSVYERCHRDPSACVIGVGFTPAVATLEGPSPAFATHLSIGSSPRPRVGDL